MKLLPIVIIALSGIILTVGDLSMKAWVANGKQIFYFIGLIIYLTGLIFLAQSFKYKNIAVASLLVVLFNVITLLFVSWLFYKETLSSIQLFGVLLGVVAVVILELN